MTSKQVQVTVPLEFQDRILQALTVHSHVHALESFPGKRSTLIIFKCLGKRLQDVLNLLHDLEVGVSFGTVDILELQSTIPRIPNPSERRGGRTGYSSVTSRKTVEVCVAIRARMESMESEIA